MLASYTQDLLGLLWRDWLTRLIVGIYLADRSFVRMNVKGGLQNPDQRISEDVKTFVQMTLSVSLMLLNGTITIFAFSGVLWSISPRLFFVGVVYATIGSAVTFLLGRRLIPLNYKQADREADFRAQLIHVRENADAIALQEREPRLSVRLLAQITALIGNQRLIVNVTRNVAYLTTLYNYLIQIIPALIVAPMFMRGDVEFGAVTQAAMAFSTLLGAFSLLVTQFQTFSSYAAVMARLNRLVDALQADGTLSGSIAIVEDGDRIAWQGLTLRAERDGRVLLHDLTLDNPLGVRLLVRSPDGASRSALLHATAGIWHDGEGRIVRPSLDHVAFLPEKPYLPPGTLREVLVGELETGVGDEEINRVLACLHADKVVARIGSLDREEDWGDVLSLREQELMAVARAILSRPRFVLLHNPGRTLDHEHITLALRALCDCTVTCLTFTGSDEEDDHLMDHDALLEIAPDGSWSWKPVRDGVIVDGEVRRATTP